MNKIFSRPQAKAHTQKLISAFNIKVVQEVKVISEGAYKGSISAWAEPEKLEIAIPEIKTLEDYLAVLHEIGHCFLKHTWKSWDETKAKLLKIVNDLQNNSLTY